MAGGLGVTGHPSDVSVWRDGAQRQDPARAVVSWRRGGLGRRRSVEVSRGAAVATGGASAAGGAAD